MNQSLYDIKVKNIQGQEVGLENYKGQVLLIVNVASKCGFTPQYKGLEQIYREYQAQGFSVLGFPCNQFGSQEPESEDKIEQFCQLNYDVSFPMFSKIEVNGGHTHPLYIHLKHNAPGILGTEAIKWNFTKFLINRQGEVIKRFAPTDTPEKIAEDIKKIL